ncbi:MAG: DNA cytosine methyltransferase [Caldisericia bacterium]|jgi:DNA (cytosine-5)-methyltransferase 1|nr:DNA cytosine methyltransferase [Caldisericia bacterium]
MEQFTFIDLFAGIGGFHIALEKLGGKCVFASEIDEKAQEVYEKNFNLRPKGDITKIDEKDIPSHDVLCAGFPCQPFSHAGFQKGMGETRGTLFFDIMRIVKHHKPKYLILENVQNLVKHDNGNTWRVISENLKEAGYIIPDEPIIVSPHQLGIPQHRKRVVILAQRKDLPNIKEVSHEEIHNGETTIDEILIDEEEIKNIHNYKLNDEQIKIVNIWDEFAKNIKGKLPGFPVWADEFGKDYDYSKLPKWKQNFIIKNRQLYEDNKEFIDSWLNKHNHLQDLAPSRRKFEWQAGNSERDIWKLIFQFRPSGLRVKVGNHFPALVAITQTSILGKRKRKLTPRETARLQSFPDDFKLHPVDSVAYKQLGNAVNVEVIKFLAEKILKD